MEHLATAGRAPTPMRPSSKRRIEMLQALVAELMVRDLGPSAVATFLRCSPSAARNYAKDLRQAGLVEKVAVGKAAGGVDKVAFRLHCDEERVRAFLATLGQSSPCRTISTTRDGPQLKTCLNARSFHIMRDDVGISLRVSNAPAQRDALVAALFGAV